MKTYNRAFDLAEDARRAEITAHHDLQQAMADVTDDGFVHDLLEKLGLVPTGRRSRRSVAGPPVWG